ncbi:hypothetical protein Tco_1299535, partial [Tanacetum coccineum]
MTALRAAVVGFGEETSTLLLCKATEVDKSYVYVSYQKIENKESVKEVVVGGGEACGVGEDELNRVIPTLKDGDGDDLD